MRKEIRYISTTHCRHYYHIMIIVIIMIVAMLIHQPPHPIVLLMQHTPVNICHALCNIYLKDIYNAMSHA